MRFSPKSAMTNARRRLPSSAFICPCAYLELLYALVANACAVLSFTANAVYIRRDKRCEELLDLSKAKHNSFWHTKRW